MVINELSEGGENKMVVLQAGAIVHYEEQLYNLNTILRRVKWHTI